MLPGSCAKAATSPVRAPLISSVRKEAEATNKLQPAALNFASIIRWVLSMRKEIWTTAPQVIDPARPLKQSTSRLPTFRGLRKCSLIGGEYWCILKYRQG